MPSKRDYGTPEYRRYRTANRYGMTVSELDTLLESQNGRCAICKTKLLGKFDIDHDQNCCQHSSKANTCGNCTRAILCHPCNIAVGHLEVAMFYGHLDNLVTYIKKHGREM